MVRSIRIEDLPQLLETFRELKLLADGTTGIESWTETKFESELRRVLGYVYEDEEIVKAFVFYRVIPDGLEISLLATRPDSRKQGVMIRVLRAMIQSLAPGKVIWLELHENNLPARNLYEKNGFPYKWKEASLLC